jgi:hypothetical protein
VLLVCASATSPTEKITSMLARIRETRYLVAGRVVLDMRFIDFPPEV